MQWGSSCMAKRLGKVRVEPNTSSSMRISKVGYWLFTVRWSFLVVIAEHSTCSVPVARRKHFHSVTVKGVEMGWFATYHPSHQTRTSFFSLASPFIFSFFWLPSMLLDIFLSTVNDFRATKDNFPMQPQNTTIDLVDAFPNSGVRLPLESQHR